MLSDDTSDYDIYLCGPMTSVQEHNIPAFNAAAAHLISLGFRVFNPSVVQSEDKQFSDYMRDEIAILLRTRKALVVLPGWESGVGSRLEVAVATSIDIPIHEYDARLGIGKSVALEGADPRSRVGHLVSSPNPTSHIDDADLPTEVAVEVPELAPHEEAAKLVMGPRGDFYDHPYDNFTRTARMWSGLLYSKLLPDEEVTAEDVALCMVSLKLAREVFRHKRDNIVDAHGYLITFDMVLERLAELERSDDERGSSASR